MHTRRTQRLDNSSSGQWQVNLKTHSHKFIYIYTITKITDILQSIQFTVLSDTNNNSVTCILYTHTVTKITDILYSIQFTALYDHNSN